MKLKDLVAVSGLPGIYRMAANRSNGLIIEDIDSGKKRFASTRKHHFTPVESISIYTDDGDSTEIKKVFRSMLQQMEDNPPIPPNSPAGELREYFFDVLPDHDEDRVHLGDIKKVIKWFNFLNERNYLSLEEEVEENEDAENEAVAVKSDEEE